MKSPTVGIIVGSVSDLDIAEKAAAVLREFDVAFEVGIASAHRTPADVEAYASGAASRGIKVAIAIAGMSAALPGVIAAHTTLPVIGVPVASGSLCGVDALYSVAQMPSGVPVASMGIDGARNAALFAVRVLSTGDEEIERKMATWQARVGDDVRASRARADDRGLPSVPEHAWRDRR